MAMGCAGPATRWLCYKAQELVGSEGEDAEHAMAHHLRGATDSYVAATELVLQSAVDALTRGAFVVPDLFRKLKADAPQAPGFSFQLLGPRLVAAGVDVNQRDVAE